MILDRLITTAVVGLTVLALWLAHYGGWVPFLLVVGAMSAGLLLGWWLIRVQDRKYRGY